MKGLRIYWLIIAVLFGIFVMVEYNRPKPIDWSRSFLSDKKAPFGLEVSYRLLPELFPNQKIELVRNPLYNQLEKKNLPPKSNYIIIEQYHSSDNNDTKKLLDYVNKGNTVFWASNSFPKKLLDTLDLVVKSNDLSDFEKAETYRKTHQGDDFDFNKIFLKDTLSINLISKSLKSKKFYQLEKESGENYFVATDSANATVLGENKYKMYNFLKIPFGKGHLYLHSVPEVFCNYYLLNQHQDPYAFKALSYLPNAPIFWDEYSKKGRGWYRDGELVEDGSERSIFRFMSTDATLKWAYYLIWATIILYMIFASKRIQRIIPIINPPSNTSLEFVQTIGRLYYQKQDHLNIAQKKIHHWKNYIRTQFGLIYDQSDEYFTEALSKKTGIELQEIKILISNIGYVERATDLSESDLLLTNQKIERFYKSL